MKEGGREEQREGGREGRVWKVDRVNEGGREGWREEGREEFGRWIE